jgi:hypothetical protein
MWCRIGSRSGFLPTCVWTYGFHKMWIIFWLAAELLPSQEELCFMEWVILTASLCCHMLMFDDARFCLVLDFVFGREYIVVLCLHFGFVSLHPSYFLLFRIWIPFYGLVLTLLVAVLENYLFCFLHMLYGNILQVLHPRCVLFKWRCVGPSKHNCRRIVFLLVRWRARTATPATPATHTRHRTIKQKPPRRRRRRIKKSIDNHILRAKPKFFTRSLLRTPDHPELTVYMSFSRILSNVMTWRWPSTAETCSRRHLTNKNAILRQLCFDGPTHPHTVILFVFW